MERTTAMMMMIPYDTTMKVWNVGWREERERGRRVKRRGREDERQAMGADMYVTMMVHH
jgi:hypothetical protein